MMIDEAAEWHRIAEERRQQLERLRLDARFQAAARMASTGRTLVRPLGRGARRARSLAVRTVRSTLALPARVRSAGKERRLRDEVRRLEPLEHPPDVPGSMTAVIVTAAQPERLDTLLAALGRIGVRALVVDNAGVPEVERVVGAHPLAEWVRLRTPVSFSEANEAAIPLVTTDWVLLLNDDVRPLDDTWAARMLSAAAADTVAVGALLVHGRRGWNGGAAVDLRVQHAGIGFVLEGPTPVPVHLGRGAVPAPRRDAPRVDAATAACLLVRTEAYRAAGGLDPGFDYGMEDVDLCLRLAQHGDIRVALDAVLLHDEGATRLDVRSGPPPAVRASRQRRNRARLLARHGVRLRRGLLDGTIVAARPIPIDVAGPLPDGLRNGSFRLRRARRVRYRGRLRRGSEPAAVVITDPRAAALAPRSASSPVIAWGGIAAEAALSDGRAGTGVTPDVVVAERPEVPGPPPGGVSMNPIHRVGMEDHDRPSDAFREAVALPRWSIRIAAPSGRRGALWGDLAVAEALCTELRGHGVVARIATIDRWGTGFDATADVAVHLKGRSVAPVIHDQCDVVWIMSHPSEIAPGELDAADLVLAGSVLLADRLEGLTSTPVRVLPQAADARRLLAEPTGTAAPSRVLFIGNTRSEPRPVVMGAIDAGLPLTLIGSGWERFVDPRLVHERAVPPRELGAWYRAAEVVLNDHWADMSRWGLVSNRVFDALACGACVVSDEVAGMDALLDGAVATFRDRADVGPTVRALLDEPTERAERAERGRRVVLAAHTWEHRAAELIGLVADATSGRGAQG